MSYALFQMQCRAIELTLALAEREYLRYPPGTIIDGKNVGGQFATGKKSGSTPPTKDVVSPRSLMEDVVKALEKRFAQSKDLEAKVQRTVTEISKNIVAQYPIDQKPLQLPGASFTQKLQAATAQYSSAESKLLIASASEQKKLLGDMIKAAIPLAVALGLTVGVEVAIGMLIGQTIGEAIVGSALVFGVSSATDKALDIAKVENPIVRASLQIVAGLATGGLVAKSIKATAMEAGRIAEVAKQFVDQATATPGVLSKIGDVRKLVTVLDKENIDSGKVLDALRREVTQDTRLKRTGAPHSFSERLKEYVDLSMEGNENKVVIGLEWRKGIIDAELKYGELIDKVHNIGIAQVYNSSKKAEKVYRDFLNSVKAGKSNQTTTGIVDKQFIDEYGKVFPKGENFVLDGFYKYRGAEFDIGKRLNEVREATSEATSLSDADLGKIFVGQLIGTPEDPARGFARTLNINYANLAKETIHYLQAGFMGDSRTLAFHETGHFIEKAKNLTKTSVNYIDSRKTKGVAHLIDSQKVAPTDFTNKYTAKTYGVAGKETATEVVSMGVGDLSSIYGLHSITHDDIDHLRYTLFALDK